MLSLCFLTWTQYNAQRRQDEVSTAHCLSLSASDVHCLSLSNRIILSSRLYIHIKQKVQKERRLPHRA